MVNGNVSKPLVVKDVLFGWLNLVFAEVLSIMLVFFTAGLMNANIMFKAIVGLCTLAILICIIGNYAYNCAKNHKAYERMFKKAHSESKPIVLGILISLPLILEWCVLLILRLSQSFTGDSFFQIYRIINAYFLPWISIICGNSDYALSSVSFMGMLTMFVFTAMPLTAYIMVYNITYHNIDIEKLIIYNKE